MKAINRMIHAALEEIDAMRSGRFMPYHRLSLMIALITCLVGRDHICQKLPYYVI